jgi:hypothetical protein
MMAEERPDPDLPCVQVDKYQQWAQAQLGG